MAGAWVYDVTEQDFEEKIIEASKQRPVVVDFWAEWCGPCQVLGPLLEKLADEMDGRFAVAKIDSDACPDLAAAFQIRSIPTVHLFKDGRPVDGFMGALGETELRKFLEPHLGPAAPSPEGGDTPEDDVGMAEALLAGGHLQAARERLEPIIAETPDDTRARLLLARIAFAADDADAVRSHVDAIGEEAPEWREAKALGDALAFRGGCSADEATLTAAVEADENDLDARYALGCCLATRGLYAQALEAFLEVVKRDKTHAEGAAHKAMLTVFGLLGKDSDVARDARRQLLIYL